MGTIDPRRAVFFVALFAILPACAPSNDNYTVTSRGPIAAPVDSRLLTYYQQFAAVAGGPVPAIRMTIGPLERGVAGKCYKPGAKPVTNQIGEIFFGDASDPEMRIVISSKYFKEHEYNPAAMHQVVFHELGHCLLGRGHDEGWINARGLEVPKSIMYTRSFGAQLWYESLIPYYEKELFGRISDEPRQPLRLKDQPTHTHEDGWECGTVHPEGPDFASAE